MSTMISFHLIATPDAPAGQKPAVALDVENVFTMSDEDSQRMLAAFVEKYTRRDRPGGGPRGPDRGAATVPTPDQAVTMAVNEFWSQLKGRTDQFVKTQIERAALAQAPAAPEVKTEQETKVNVALSAEATPVAIKG